MEIILSVIALVYGLFAHLSISIKLKNLDFFERSFELFNFSNVLLFNSFRLVFFMYYICLLYAFSVR